VTVLGAKQRGVDNNIDHNLRMKGTSYADSSVVTWNTDPPDHLDHAAAPLSATRLSSRTAGAVGPAS
jgi:hypothetical protein